MHTKSGERTAPRAQPHCTLTTSALRGVRSWISTLATISRSWNKYPWRLWKNPVVLLCYVHTLGVLSIVKLWYRIRPNCSVPRSPTPSGNGAWTPQLRAPDGSNGGILGDFHCKVGLFT